MILYTVISYCLSVSSWLRLSTLCICGQKIQFIASLPMCLKDISLMVDGGKKSLPDLQFSWIQLVMNEMLSNAKFD